MHSHFVGVVMRQLICCEYSLESHCLGDSNENLQHVFMEKHKKLSLNYHKITTDKTSKVQNKIAFEPGHEKMCLMPYANNKGADHPAHSRSPISAFVVRCRDRMILPVYISRNFKILAGLCS